jgi:hypothetical protein
VGASEACVCVCVCVCLCVLGGRPHGYLLLVVCVIKCVDIRQHPSSPSLFDGGYYLVVKLGER